MAAILSREMLDRLGSLVQHDNVQNTQIRVIDLNVFKARLAGKWERVGAFVHKSFENAIRKELSRSDAALRYDEFTYVIVFHNATFDTAQLKCAAILTEVVALCFGEHWDAAAYDNLIHKVDPHSVPMDVTVDAKPSSQVSQDVAFALDSGTLQGENEPLERPLSFLYRPLWDAVRNVVLHYLCQPYYGNSDHASPGPAANQEFRARLAAGAVSPEPDFASLQECVTRIEKLRRDGFRVLIGSQIHFETLSDPRRWTRCAALLNQVPRTVLDDLGFLVVGIDDGVPPSRLQTVLSKLAKNSRAIYCVVQDGTNAAARFAGTGTHAIGIALGSTKGSERNQIEKIRRIATQASALNMQTFILNASTSSLTLNAIASGIRYVEGEIICPPTSDPRYAFVREVEDLYRGKLKQPEAESFARLA